MVDLETLLSEKTPNIRRQTEAHRKEAAIRVARAQSMAMTALVRLHKGDYDVLFQQAKAKVNAQRGPLPE